MIPLRMTTKLLLGQHLLGRPRERELSWGLEQGCQLLLVTDPHRVETLLLLAQALAHPPYFLPQLELAVLHLAVAQVDLVLVW